MTNEQYVAHEVRLQLVETAITKIDAKFDFIEKRFDRLDDEIKSIRKDHIDLMKQNFNYFLTTIGIILALFGGMILNKVF